MSRAHRRLNKRQWARSRWAALERDGWRCVTCGKAGRLQVDHVRRLQDGGDAYKQSNLQSLCEDCHRRKSAEENELPDPERTAWRLFMRE